jgi:Predicted flavin-nucleotide-binding protein structurally related to pyridoxine 5''-phosphate oxidase
MAKLNNEIRKEFDKTELLMVGTSSKNGEPNVVPIIVFILQPDNETLWIVDNYLGKTLSNIKENPRVAFSLHNDDGADSYQIKGTIVAIENSGPDYEKAVEIAHKKEPTLPARSLVKIKFTDFFYVTIGPKAGQRV